MVAEESRFEDRVKPRLARSTRWVLGALGCLLVLAGAYWTHAVWALGARRTALLARRDAAAADLPQKDRAFLDAASAFIVDAATAPASADVVAPEFAAGGGLARLLAAPGLYVRTAVPDVRKPRFVPEAIRRSAKDALVACLFSAGDANGDYELVVASSRTLPGSPVFEEETRRMQRLDVVQRGLRVFASDWPGEVREANDLGLRAFEYEFEQRTPEAVAAARTWAAAAYLLVVIDELPAGMKPPAETTELAASFESPSLPAIQGKPHAVRVALFDFATQKPLLRMRRDVDPAALAARTGAAEAAAAEDCRLAVAARRLAGSPAR